MNISDERYQLFCDIFDADGDYITFGQMLACDNAARIMCGISEKEMECLTADADEVSCNYDACGECPQCLSDKADIERMILTTE